jgi:hypothetical protein
VVDQGFNLLLCYFATGEKERMKKGFSKLVNVKPIHVDQQESIDIRPAFDNFVQDNLRSFLVER